MNTLLAMIDNPIFVKHMRSRLRRSQVLSPAVIVFVLCLFISYAGYQFNGFKNGTCFGFFLGLQLIILAIIGSTQVASSVGGARESGILDFHRVSPLSPLAVTLGFFFGAPVREYLLFLITLPFCVICVANGAPGILGFLEIEICVCLISWLLQSISLLNALSSKKPKGGAKGAIGLVFLLLIFGQPISMIGRAASSLDDSLTFPFFGVPLHWLLNAFIYIVPTLGLILLASVRKMRSERAHAFSKLEAVFCLATQVFLTIGGTWVLKGFTPLVLITVYAISFFACIMSTTVTPNLGEYSKGVRRAERQGLKRLNFWDDLALNRIALIWICLVVLAGTNIIWFGISNKPADPRMNLGPATIMDFTIPIATAVLSIFYFGSALQYFALSTPRRSGTFMGLFIFFAWIVPLIAGALGLLGNDPKLSAILASISPVIGVGVSAFNSNQEIDSNSVRLATILPALIFFVLFNTLVTSARRKVLAHIHAGPDRSKPRGHGSEAVGDESDLILS